jgi:hypothetical protein
MKELSEPPKVTQDPEKLSRLEVESFYPSWPSEEGEETRKWQAGQSEEEILQNKGEIRWQQAKRETRNTGKGISR